MPGLTPAYAGNIALSPSYRNVLEAHPRIRGEYFVLSVLAPNVSGSPQHTRGISAVHPHRAFICGLTPAYAGNIKSAEVCF